MLRRRPFLLRDSAALLIGMGAGLRSARIGRHGGRPSKGTAASGWLISRIAGEAEAEVEAPISCIVGVGVF
jgi:hypothetical protein